jgi:hypothetical protein
MEPAISAYVFLVWNKDVGLSLHICGTFLFVVIIKEVPMLSIDQ